MARAVSDRGGSAAATTALGWASPARNPISAERGRAGWRGVAAKPGSPGACARALGRIRDPRGVLSRVHSAPGSQPQARRGALESRRAGASHRTKPCRWVPPPCVALALRPGDARRLETTRSAPSRLVASLISYRPAGEGCFTSPAPTLHRLHAAETFWSLGQPAQHANDQDSHTNPEQYADAKHHRAGQIRDREGHEPASKVVRARLNIAAHPPQRTRFPQGPRATFPQGSQHYQSRVVSV